MRYDLHTHTLRYSPNCGRSLPEEMCARALETGLNGIALTDHETWWPHEHWQRLCERFAGLTIFRGVEYNIEDNDFLAFIPEPDQGPLIVFDSVSQLVEQVHQFGGVVIWAHPFRWTPQTPPWLSEVQPDGMEVASNHMNESISAAAQVIAKLRRIPMFHNSDSHHVSTLGAFYNEIDQELRSEADLVRYIQARQRLGEKG